jgi:hypothetical protein
MVFRPSHARTEDGRRLRFDARHPAAVSCRISSTKLHKKEGLARPAEDVRYDVLDGEQIRNSPLVVCRLVSAFGVARVRRLYELDGDRPFRGPNKR